MYEVPEFYRVYIQDVYRYQLRQVRLHEASPRFKWNDWNVHLQHEENRRRAIGRPGLVLVLTPSHYRNIQPCNYWLTTGGQRQITFGTLQVRGSPVDLSSQLEA